MIPLDRALGVLMEMAGARSGAVFSGGGQLRLRASRGIDQEVLDAARLAWERFRGQLEAGKLFAIEGRPFVLLPLKHGQVLEGVVYLDRLDQVTCPQTDCERLLGTITRAMTRDPDDAPPPLWSGLLAAAPMMATLDVERERLILALENNEWNIARVARLMGVTRRTIYLRLQRYRIPRQWVRKTPDQA